MLIYPFPKGLLYLQNLLHQFLKKNHEEFAIGKKVFTQEKLLNLIEERPELFSFNACARPVIQSILLPTLAYVAGPAEMAYHCQLKDYFEFHEISMPWIVPRLCSQLTFNQTGWNVPN